MARHLGSGDGLTGTDEPSVTIDRASADCMFEKSFGFSVTLFLFRFIILFLFSVLFLNHLRASDLLPFHSYVVIVYFIMSA